MMTSISQKQFNPQTFPGQLMEKQIQKLFYSGAKGSYRYYNKFCSRHFKDNMMSATQHKMAYLRNRCLCCKFPGNRENKN